MKKIRVALIGIDVVFLAADKEVSKKYGSFVSQQKIRTIDLTEIFSDDKSMALVVSGVNIEIIIKEKPFLIANPHPVTIILFHVFNVIMKSFHIVKATCFVLQPVSQYGQSGIDELINQSLDVLRATSFSCV